MSAALSEKLNEIGEAMAALGTLFTEASALYDAESAKSGKSGGGAAAGKISGPAGKTAVGSKGAKAAAVAGDDDDDLPPPEAAGGKKGKTAAKSAGKKAKAVTEDDVRAAAKKVIEQKGKDRAVEILGEYGNGKLADVEESDYPACLAALEAALVEEEEEAAGTDVDDI